MRNCAAPARRSVDQFGFDGDVAVHLGAAAELVVAFDLVDFLDDGVAVDVGQGFDLDTTGTRRGLGLVSMKERAEGLNGSLTINSTPGAGTRVKINFSRNSFNQYTP